ncbi:MAG TPA: tryptophan synthase subunit alpha [Candidatus Acidoferrales bacterium]|nr:tryptophan synthase subunit alpha [Candidatus Acidoferrales bacterium]
MNRIEAKFAELKAQRKAALIPFVEAGDPDLESTLELLSVCEENGADLIELGVPFSDPMADGPTIQRASQRALDSGTSLTRVLDLVRDFRRRSEMPLVLFGYYNPMFHLGPKRLARAAQRAGVDGVLCVDLPPEESGELKRWLRRAGLDQIFLLAPTSDARRIRSVARAAEGFIYYVSVTGVTGARKRFVEPLPEQVARVRRYSKLPIVVGFGVSTPEQAAWIASFADGVVVASALIDYMEGASRPKDRIARAGRFVARLKRAMRAVTNGN